MYDYTKYWEGEFERRKKLKYYEKLYNKYKDFYKFNKSDKIIDIGGGNGHFLHFFGIKKATIIDISDSGLKFAKQKFGYETIKCNLYDRWPVKENYYDIAFCMEVLEHLRYPSLVIAEVYKVLKRGGILYIGQPNMKPDGKHHVKRIHFKYLKELLEENGFIIEDYIICPGFLTNKLSNLKNTESIRKKLLIIVGSILNIMTTYSTKNYLAYKIPYMFGGFYHVKARKA